MDLDQRARHQEAGRADGGARWRYLEEFLPYFVEAIEIVEVGHEDLRLDHLIEGAARRLERALEIVEDIAGLLLDVRAVIGEGRIPFRLGGDARLVVARDLAGREDP